MDLTSALEICEALVSLLEVAPAIPMSDPESPKNPWFSVWKPLDIFGGLGIGHKGEGSKGMIGTDGTTAT